MTLLCFPYKIKFLENEKATKEPQAKSRLIFRNFFLKKLQKTFLRGQRKLKTIWNESKFKIIVSPGHFEFLIQQ